MHPKLRKLIEKHLYTTNEYGVEHQDPSAKVPDELLTYFKREHSLKTDVHKTCITCQIRQFQKYGSNRIKCSYIPRKLPDGAASKIAEISKSTNIPKEQATKILKASIDPVAWTELMFGFSDKDPKWFLRNYQKEQIRCTSKRLVVREGRRSGKTFAIALKLIYYAFNTKLDRGRDAQGNTVYMGPAIMIVTPYQAQLTNIFEEMEKLVKRNVELKSEITSGTGDSLYIKTPTYKMVFRNGCTIQGFVSGIGIRSDGSGGGTMRGQSASIVYLDEMDMIPEEVLDKVINPILATTPETILIATSTPIGKKGKFHEWCSNRDDFREDFLPSSVIPHWEEIKEEVLRDSTQESFMAEYMAVFVEDLKGVFKKEWVYNARLDYTYDETYNDGHLKRKLGLKSTSNCIKAIGIDWNKNAGTEFYVVGFYPQDRIWIGLDAVNVPHSEFSAKRWIRELVDLNHKWKPDHIYADEGYGHTIIEDIKYQSYTLRAKKDKTPKEEETVLIADRLVSFNFSSNIKLKDPITNADIKKSGKHFLVENAVRILQDGLFKFPVDDLILKDQFFNYIVEKRNKQTNKPVYGKQNEKVGDHRLDAFMLALGGLVLEESIYSGNQMTPSMPTFHKIEALKVAYRSPNDEIKSLYDQKKQQANPGALNILKIMRGGGSEEEDRMIKEKYKQQGLWPDDRKRSRSRSINKEEEFSLLEGINTYQGTQQGMQPISELKHAPKRGRFGRKKRSWR
ncbi:hypothetical protein CMI37_26030 [Candidatus Pacearchaeota archaeon]|nr:hypothetical protein [Candidatus Pacearchaeota archaeon]